LVLEPLTAARAVIERYRETWEANFQRLDLLLEELQQAPTTTIGDNRARRRKTKKGTE
jgi:hypothetical protein